MPAIAILLDVAALSVPTKILVTVVAVLLVSGILWWTYVFCKGKFSNGPTLEDLGFWWGCTGLGAGIGASAGIIDIVLSVWKR